MENSIRVGWFLAVRQLRRSNIWATLLIVFVMMLTFLNLVVVNGILIGLPVGANAAYEDQYSGDVLIATPIDRPYIQDTTALVSATRARPDIVGVSPRYTASGVAQAHYQELRRPDRLPNQVPATVAGIDPEAEASVTGLANLIVEGEYLETGDELEVLVGTGLLERYSRVGNILGFESLEGVEIGEKIRIFINNAFYDVTVKGVVETKVNQVQRRIFFTDTTMKKILSRRGGEVDEIALRVAPGVDAVAVRDELRELAEPGASVIQTSQESQGQFLTDISNTFGTLGNLIGAVGLAVASITVFILIFINAIMRKKYIGILKGIGIEGRAIEISYVLQALFYAVVGSALGLVVLYAVIKPYVDRNPIDFPFSDGLLIAPVTSTVMRLAVLLIVTLIAGYVPAKLIVRGNTLDAILGR